MEALSEDSLSYVPRLYALSHGDYCFGPLLSELDQLYVDKDINP